MKIIFALGGSVVVPDQVDETYVEEFAAFAKRLAKKHRIGVVVGGGQTARRAIKEARARGENEAKCDYAGIEGSRYNAAIVAQAMGIDSRIPETVMEAGELLEKNGIVIMGGTEPGKSTDGVAVLLAEYADADMVLKVTDVKGIYDKDPNKFKDAKMFTELPVATLDKMVMGLSQAAGKYELFDIVAVKMMERSGIKCIVLDGHDLKNMEAAVEGKKFVGTVIKK